MGAGARAEAGGGLSRSIKGVVRIQGAASARCESAKSASFISVLEASYSTTAAKNAGFDGTEHVHPLEWCSSTTCFSASRDTGRKSELWGLVSRRLNELSIGPDFAGRCVLEHN